MIRILAIASVYKPDCKQTLEELQGKEFGDKESI